MTAILGISAYYHDSAAALVIDGEIVAAAQEERFTRIKHDHAFPSNAIAYCLEEAGLSPGDLDYVGFYDKPFLKFERILETYLAFAPQGFRSFLKAMPLWMRQKLHLPREIRREFARISHQVSAAAGDAPHPAVFSRLGVLDVPSSTPPRPSGQKPRWARHLAALATKPGEKRERDGEYRRRIVFCEHHESHAASAFFPSPFEEAAILTLDGVGEWATASFGSGRGNRIELSHELHFPHSLGLLYSAFTYFCGFRVNSGEYKLMGLAPYGEPCWVDEILDKLLDLKEDGSFRLDLSYFNYCQGLTMTSRKFDRLFGGPPRTPETPLTQREMDLAASIQKVTEEIVLRTVRHLHQRTGMKNLCLAGGVALNCVGNGRILREGPFEKIWIQPAAGDAGGALGTALFIWYQLLGNERRCETPDAQRGSLLGPQFSSHEIRAFLDQNGSVYHRFTDEGELDREIVDLIEDEKVVGLFHGRMEFGPRALGCRSIIGDARSRSMQSVMNLKIKFRESFRPFAPIVLRERASEFFDLDEGVDSPYMLLVASVAESKRTPVDDDGAHGLDKLKLVRSEVPAITHVDSSARVQTVDPVRHERLHRLMSRFAQRTGCPVMINTSFNVRGEPIVCTPEHAYHCFMGTDMDVLVLEDCILLKTEQPEAGTPDRERYLAQFELD